MAKFIAVCVGICLFLSPSLTFAQKGKSAPVMRGYSPSPKLRHADHNQNGVTTPKEIRAEKKKDDRFVNKAWEKKADTNQDGIVDKKEMGQMKDKEPLNWKDKSDLNNDGTVDDHEAAMWKGKHLLPPNWKKTLDLNNDGNVDEKEFRLFKEKQNSDGTVSENP